MDRRRALRLAARASVVPLLARAISSHGATVSSAVDWGSLRRTLGSRLIKVTSPLDACAKAGGAGADALFAQCKNPYYLGDEPALTQTLGWVGAWTSHASDYAVAAESAADVAAAIDFARRNRIRLVVKGGGHSYFGNSNAAHSLLVWTRRMQGVTLHDAFVPQGSPANVRPLPAVSIGAGSIWGRVYDAVSVQAGRYVQGGGCMTVGVSGFILGGGFGSFSKQFGTGAGSLLEAEVVTADGKVRIANASQEPELFFALQGGGGGTFGVVTRLTLRTHPLPETMGAVQFEVQAKSDDDWRALVGKSIAFYGEALCNPHWGEQIRFAPDRTLTIAMTFQSLSQEQARAVWQPFLTWVAERPQAYTRKAEPIIVALPGRRFWDAAYLKQLPGVVIQDQRPAAPANNVFWAGNLGEAGQVLHSYQSAWIPSSLLDPSKQALLVDALVAGSAQWPMTLHTNKGLAGGSAEALSRSRATATNPQVLSAFALLICAADGPPAWRGIPGHEPNVAEGKRQAAAVTRAMAPIRKLLPTAGAYVSEAYYFDDNWQQRYWGQNYERLLRAKKRYDPTGMFMGRNTVGSAR
jgi:FAD/FMN-containing dehydrogenase